MAKQVLLINYEYPPLGGGTGVANEYLVKEFEKVKGLKLNVLTSSVDKYRENRISNKISIVRLGIGKKNKNLHHQSALDLFRFFIQSTKWVMEHKDNYDLIHAFSGLPGGITAWLSRKPYMVSLRGGDEPGYEPRFDKLLKLMQPLLALVYGKAKSVDTNSQYLKNLALKSFPGLKIRVIRNGVDRKIFYPAKQIVKKPIVLCTSRWGQRKGVKFLVKAMTEVREEIPQAELWLAGEGAERGRLGGRKGIKFLGKVEHKRLGTIYRKAKVFVLPSLSESTSNSLLEALACGLPVVATKVGGNSELVNKQNRVLVPAADSQALAEAVVKLLKKEGKAGLTKVYSWRKAAREYLKLYSLALAG